MTAPLRVASLLPSATEMVCAVGCRDSLVGLSHECDFPLELPDLPRLTSTRISAPGSKAIDGEVRDLLREALAVYDLDLGALRAARPDVIVTQDLCDVCAVSYDDVCRAARELANPDLVIVNLHPTRLGEILDDLVKVGEALGRTEAARERRAEMEERIEAVRARATAAGTRPKVLTIEWIDPVMVGGTWMPELVDLAGGEPMVTSPGDHAPTLTEEELSRLDPDVVLVKPCGYALERTRAEGAELERVLRALAPGAGGRRVYVADGNAYFNRPGPRIVESLEILAGCVHPGVFEGERERYAGAVERWRGGE